MPDKSRAPHRRGTKVTLRAIATVKELQENPLLGEFRIHAALKRLGIFLSPAHLRAHPGPQPQALRPAQAGAGPPRAQADALQGGAAPPVLVGRHPLSRPRPGRLQGLLGHHPRQLLAGRRRQWPVAHAGPRHLPDGPLHGDPAARGAGGAGDRRRERLPRQAVADHPRAARRGQARDRAAPSLAELHRGQLRDPTTDRRLGLRSTPGAGRSSWPSTISG